MASMLGKHKITVETANLADGDSIAAFLTSAAGTLLTHTTIGSKEHLDTKGPSEHLDGSAYAAGTSHLSAAGAVDEAGNFQPLRLNAANELIVAATVDMTGDYAEDSAHTTGDIGLFTLAVRRDARTSGTSADGDYASMNVNANGELYTHDADALAQLLLANSSLDAIEASVAAIDADTSSIITELQTANTSLDNIEADAEAIRVELLDQGTTLDSLLTELSDQGTTLDGILSDTAAIQTAVEAANSALLQQQVSVATTATLLPASALANRRSLLVQNAGSASIWIGSATVTTSGATTGIEVPKGGFIELEVGPAVSVYARAAAGTVNANILQMA